MSDVTDSKTRTVLRHKTLEEWQAWSTHRARTVETRIGYLCLSLAAVVAVDHGTSTCLLHFELSAVAQLPLISLLVQCLL